MGAYGRLCTAFYDLDKPHPPEDAIAFYRSRLATTAGPILEPMCGSGRYLVPLCESGFDVDGADASQEMLAACRRRASAAGLAPALYHQSLRELSIPRRYAAALVPAGSLGLACEPGELQAGLARIRDHLLPGAELLVELVDFDAGVREVPERIARSVGAADGTVIEYACDVTVDRSGRFVRYDGCYEMRAGQETLAREEEVIFLNVVTSSAFLDALHDAGFDDPRIVETDPKTGWLVSSECKLYAGRAPA